MKVRSTTLFTVLLGLLFTCRSVQTPAQRKGVRTPSSSAPQRARVAEYSDRPFDPAVGSVPLGFHGHNLVEIYQRLATRRKAGAKSEFETTEAFRQRMQAEANKAIIGSLTEKSTFAYVISKLESEYDADRQVLHVRTPLTRAINGNVYSNDSKAMAVEWNSVVSQDSYVGSNAYGARVKVDRILANNYNVAFDNYDQFQLITYLDKRSQELVDEDEKTRQRLGNNRSTSLAEDLKKRALATDLSMDAQTALRAKTSIRLLLVCWLASPYVLEGAVVDSPTIDHPTEYFIKDYSLNTQLLEVWFFNASTGQIYARQRAAERPIDAPSTVATVKPFLDLFSWEIKPDNRVPDYSLILGEVRNISEGSLDNLRAEIKCRMPDGSYHNAYLVDMVDRLSPHQCARFVGHLAGASSSCEMVFTRFDRNEIREITLPHVMNARKPAESESSGCTPAPLDRP